MRKYETEGTGMFLALLLFSTGAIISAGILMLNSNFPVKLALGSMLSPTGAQFTFLGLRIKHWLTGILIIIFSLAITFSKSENIFIHQIGYTMLGAGAFLVADEYEAVWRTLTTGEYP